jgi:hypothetical protein
MVCFLGGWGRGRGDSMTHSSWFVFSLGDTSFRTTLLCYLLYILNSGGFVSSSSDHHEGVPGPRRPGQRTCAVQASTTRRPVPHIEDSEGSDTPRSVTDSTFSLGPSSGSSGSVRIYRRVIFGK